MKASAVVIGPDQSRTHDAAMPILTEDHVGIVELMTKARRINYTQHFVDIHMYISITYSGMHKQDRHLIIMKKRGGILSPVHKLQENPGFSVPQRQLHVASLQREGNFKKTYK